MTSTDERHHETESTHKSRAKGMRVAWSKVVLLTILCAFAAVGFLSIIGFSGYVGAWFGSRGTSRFTSTGATVEQVRSLKLLTVMSFQITTDMEGEHADRKGVWLAKGSADYVVDFSKVKVERLDETQRSVTLKLPEPMIRSARLDPVKTRLLTYQKTGWGWWTLGMMGSRDEFETKSREMLQKRIELAAAETPLIESAKASASQLMSSIYNPVGWTVTIEWVPGGGD